MLSLTLSLLLAYDPNSMPQPRPPPVAHDVVVVVETSAPHRHALASLRQELWAIGRNLAPSDLTERTITAEGDGAPAPLFDVKDVVPLQEEPELAETRRTRSFPTRCES